MFGTQVRAHRQRLGMTQEELAARDTFDDSRDTDAAPDSWLAALTIFTELEHPGADLVPTRLRDTS